VKLLLLRRQLRLFVLLMLTTSFACGEVKIDTDLPVEDVGIVNDTTTNDVVTVKDVVETDTAVDKPDVPTGPKCETDTDCLLKVTGQTPCRLSTCDKGTCTEPLPLDKGTLCSQPNLSPGACQLTACDDQGECVINSKEDDTVCGPTKCGKRCDAGVCRDDTPEDYEDGNPCTNVFCDQGVEVVTENLTDLSLTCDDGDECTGDEACIKGKCQGQAKSCNDGIACTLDVCDKATGCSNVPNDTKCTGDDPCVNLACSVTVGCAPAEDKPFNVGANCDDGSDCTPKTACDDKGSCVGDSTCGCEADKDCADQGDLCEPWVCDSGSKKCVPDAATKVICDNSGDGPCTETSCDPKTGQCGTANVNEGKTCDDNDVCTSTTKCDKGSCAGKLDMKCDDGNDCTVDSCDPIAGCQKVPGDGDCDDGNPCTNEDACTSGACKGVVIGCNDGIDCTYDACDAKTGKCTNTAKNDLCNDDEQCTDDICDKAKGCTQKAKVDAKCDDGDKCTNAVCGKTGKCDKVASYNKEIAGCGCQKDSECKSSSACTVGKCVKGECTFDPKPKNGQACETGNKCHVAKSGKCDAGSCTGGKAKDCNSAGDGKCMVGQCDAVSGKCVAKAKGDGTTCDADGSKCTPKDKCKAGKCLPDVAKNCSSLNKACVLGVCNKSSGACESKPKADKEPCDDGNFCTVLEACKAGKCSGGSLKTCSEENDACNKGKCDAKGGKCTKVPKSSGTACDDGKYCNISEVCDGKGSCAGGKPRTCAGDTAKCLVGACDEGKNACTKKTAPNGTTCSDGNKCTLTDKCSSGACKGSNPKNCASAGDQCNTGVCTTSTGACVKKAKSNGTACSDGNACTLSDKCSSGSCKAGTPKNCNDNNACTIGDKCDKGNCIPGAKKVCNDKNSCTTDSCTTSTGKCLYKPIIGCGGNCAKNSDCKSDGNVCTNDLCSSGKSCTYVNNTSSCTDGNACTQSDKCSSGSCKSGSNKVCPAKTCNTVSCNKSTGNCDYKVTYLAKCSDGNSCTTSDKCGKTGICAGTAIKCNDGKLCTSDKCISGKCVYLNNTVSCSDNNKCTLNDKCYAGKCKSGSSVICKQDLTKCTTHYCDSKTGGCTVKAAYDGSSCESGYYSSCYSKSCNCKLGETKVGGKYSDYLYEAELDGKGGIVAVGRSYGSGTDGYIVRFDKSRKVVWSKTVSNTSSTDILNSVAKTTKGTWVAAGYRYSSKTGYDGWLVEFDINGNIKKQIVIAAGSKHDYLFDVVVDKYGKVYAAGYSLSFGSYYRGWLVKVDLTTSKVEWQKNLAPSSTKHYYLKGLYYDSSYNRLTAVGYTNHTIYGGQDGLVAQWSTSGSFYWYQMFGAASTDSLEKITYSYGYLWAVGSSYVKGSSHQGWAIRIHRTSKLTKPYSDVRHGSTSSDAFYNVIPYSSGTVVVGRKYDGKYYRGWFMRLSSSGAKQYEHLHGTAAGSTYLYDVKYIGSSVFHSVGYTPGSGNDGFLVGTTYTGTKKCSSGGSSSK